MNLFSNRKFILIIIFILALCLRLYGLNWDQGQHLHPDERYLTMVANDIHLPATIGDYFNSATSPLNPYNYPQYTSFVYGTLPLFITKIVAVILHFDDYDHLVLVGRGLSAVFDSFNIILLFFLANKIFNKKSKFVYLPSLFYAVTVLPIQLSHFFAVDTFLNMFLLTSFTLLAYDLFPLAAITFGLASACKISAIYFVPTIILFLIKKYFDTKDLLSVLRITFYGFLLTFITIRIFQPYAFSGLFNIDSRFLNDLKTFQFYASRDGNYPPGVHWLIKTPIIFPLQNIIIIGLGLPISIMFFISTLKSLSHPKLDIKFIAYFWVFFLFIFQGSQFAHTLRYFLPIYPLIILLSFNFASPKTIKPFLIFQIIICLSFINIYSVPHSRNQASLWIYQHLPQGSTITNEYWDDPLPMYLPGYNPSQYNGTMVSPYDPDSDDKINKLMSQVNSANFLIMSSNRLWGSIPLVPQKYPLTAKFYQDLFAQKINFTKLIEINSYPGIRLPFLSQCYYFGPTNFPSVINRWFATNTQCNYPGIYFRDDTAEEAFTVYDHPKVLIFKHID